jgi:glycogen debranching enzyme
VLADVLGHRATAVELASHAAELRDHFERAFWSDDLGSYVLALDGHKQPCQVRTSNAGHVLYTGTASPERAAAVARALLAGDSFSGWGIRTLSTRERRYNPMSYHNGSVWPHDNALIAAGMARYGMKDEAIRILTGLFDASLFVDMHRLPELFCGFPRRVAEGPTRYPVACAPQAWAAGAAFMLLQSVLGLSVDGASRRLTLERPQLPEFLDWVRLTGLQIGAARVDLELRRHGSDVGVIVTRREGAVEVQIVK